MKIIKVLFLLCVLFGGSAKAQNDSIFNDDLFEDPIKIASGEEQHYFKYALTLLKQDSAVKAYQVLSRLRNITQHGETLKEVNTAIKKSRKKITKQSNDFLRGTWELDYEGDCNYARCIDSTRVEKMMISKKKISFYEKDRPVKVYRYTNRMQINSYFGYIHYLMMYKKSFEDWVYNIRLDSKGKKRLHITRDNGMSHGYFAVYIKSEEQK